MLGVEPVIAKFLMHVDRAAPGHPRGVYLSGSWVAGGLRPDSDIDLLLVTERPLSEGERGKLLEFLLRFSGRRATATPGRPLELTSLVLDDVVPWNYPPVCDFLYGEWLRDEFSNGDVPQRQVNPDLAVLITTTRQHAECLRGPHPRDLFGPVPASDLHRSIHDSLDPLLVNLAGDERNVLLTLARMVVTVETDQIVSKDEAAERILLDLPERHRQTLSLAAEAYLGHTIDDWDQHGREARDTAEHLAARLHGRLAP